MTDCFLRAMASHQPSTSVTNEDLERAHPNWSGAKVASKIGIRARPTAAAAETAADLAQIAADKLFSSRPDIDRRNIDTLIFVSQSPDYVLPSTACVLQHKLGLADTVSAFDINLGCSALPYSMWFVRSLVASHSARSVLVLYAETYTKYCDPDDMTTTTLFSDGAAAFLFGANPDRALAKVGAAKLGTDGAGFAALIVEGGGARAAARGASGAPMRLHMDGPAIFRFALDRVKPQIDALLLEQGLTAESIDRYFFHQANRFMLEALRTNLRIPAERMPIDVEHIGNAATASLPILLVRQMEQAAFPRPCRSLVVGFGVGLSWGTCVVDWLAPT